MAMSDDFGLINLVVSPFLERVAREERLGDEQPRKQRYVREKLPNKTEDSPSLDETEGADDSMSSTHIDLRI
jgi:hypothetical protein